MELHKIVNGEKIILTEEETGAITAEWEANANKAEKKVLSADEKIDIILAKGIDGLKAELEKEKKPAIKI